MESTAKYIVPVVGGPFDGAVLYLTAAPAAVLHVPGYLDLPAAAAVDARSIPLPYCGTLHKYLLQPSPARYIYEHLACS